MEHSSQHVPFSWARWGLKLDGRLTRCFINCALLLIIIPLFVPLMPKMPASGVDPSWALGLNQAIAQGLAFGTDIIFTLGPYSAIYTKFYHPATDSMMLWGSLYLACSYWLALMLLNTKVPLRWLIAITLFLLTLVYAKDSLLFSYSLLVGLTVFRFLRCDDARSLPLRSLWLILLLAPFGLLPLIKGSLLLLCGSVACLTALLFMLNRYYLFSALTLLTPVLALVVFWVFAGQPIGTLFSYISSSLVLAFSFTAAMSTVGTSYEVISYAVTGVVLLLVILKEPLPGPLRLFLGSLFFLFLFLSFKAGFARHFGHALIPATSILMAALFLPYCFRAKYIVLVVFLALSTSLYIEGHYTQITLIKNIQSTYSAAWHGLWHRVYDKEWLKNNFDLTMNYLRAKNEFPVLAGTSDIYSYEQTDLIASGNHWSPRPIMQSYSAFNAALARVNQQHLLGAHSPNNIFFKIQPIDNRLPALEDGLSWQELFFHYQPKLWGHEFLLLQKKKSTKEPVVRTLVPQMHQMGHAVTVPQTEQLVFVELDIKPTVWGSLMNFLYKSRELNISVLLADGSQKHYRLIAPMAKSGFLLSPFVEQTKEFMLLYQSALMNKKVVSFMIQAPEDTFFRQWNSQYQVTFKLIS